MEKFAPESNGGPLHIVRSLFETLRRRSIEKYGTREERRAAYAQLHAACEALFTIHTDKVGTLDRSRSRQPPYKRLLFSGLAGADKVIIDKEVASADVFTVSVLNTTNGPFESPLIHDYAVHDITPGSGHFRTVRHETDFPHHKHTTTRQRPLAASVARDLARQLTPDLQPVTQHPLLVNARYESN